MQEQPSARRLSLYIQNNLTSGLQWVAFQPNDERLWTEIRLYVESFMHGLYLQHAFAGPTPETCYQVVCDASTTQQADIDNGIVNIIVRFAPAEPGEFVTLHFQCIAGQPTS